MLRTLKRLISDGSSEAPRSSEYERRQLELAVAGLLLEMARADLQTRPEELRAAAGALHDLFGTGEAEARALLDQAGEPARRFTSYFGPVSVIKRWYSQEERIRVLEQLWRVAYAEGALDPHEDHFVRKIAHLLYVHNTDCMLARNRARPGGGT